MSQKYEKLKTLLKELFQLDQPDLDFGLYRIMHAKSAEITQFLDVDLLPQVKQAFGLYKTADKAELEKELAKAIEQAVSLGADPESLPKVKELRSRLANEAVDVSGLESEVYDHLFSFFRRYYSDGDFLAKRVYKPGVYAIPYEGEEVTLYWANQDQYYIKTSEYLRDYAFRLKPHDPENPMRVHFRLVDAVEGEHGNVKAAEGKERIFILAAGGESGHDFLTVQAGEHGPELSIGFEYRPSTLTDWSEGIRGGKTKPPTQKELVVDAGRRILGVGDHELSGWIVELNKPHVNASGEVAEYSRLQSHLGRYVARNTFDYFIHKDLGTFLRRELDFYIKNEVMHLDDVQNESAPRVEQFLSKIKVIRRIGDKIITFLAQLEDFQRKLWLKKKFVVETNYCITLDRIPEELYPEIAANDSQRREWVKLFAIDEIDSNLSMVGYSIPLSVEFLRQELGLALDTTFFSAAFTAKIIESIHALDKSTNGIAIHSENEQALLLMEDRFQGKIECIHIDPPYNTQTSGFLYRNTYQHSSWLAMMSARLHKAVSLLTDNGGLLCHIDENEYERLRLLCDELSLPDAGTIIWDKRNPMLGRKGVATQHEYVIWRTRKGGPLYFRNAAQRKILSRAESIILEHGGVTPASRSAFASWIAVEPGLSGGERANKFLNDDKRIYQSVGMGAPEMREDKKFFIPLKHPETKRDCPVPPNGWSRTPETLRELLDRDEIIFGEDESTQPRRKVFLTDDSQRQVPSVIQESSRGKTDMDDLGLFFPYCHPLSLYVDLLGATAPSSDAIALDFFAGSGTNGHAIIELNRDENTDRKYVLVEAGGQFDSVLRPRLMKAAYAPKWDAGKPKMRSNSLSQCFKYLRLESYDDTLNNLDVGSTPSQQRLLSDEQTKGFDGFKEQYTLRYMLDVETRGSQSLLNIKAFQDPTSYKLLVKRAGSDESRETNVDLLETFNWLVGLTVKNIAAPMMFSAEIERDSEKRLRLKGRIKQDDSGPWWFRTVTGTTPDGRQTLIIWRKLTGDPERDNLVLDEWFTKQGYSTRDYEFQLIYVNGDNNLENLKTPNDTWKVRLIEEDFHRLMFDTEGL
jgi:adenine-specific DNA-methyltransferase